MAPNGPDMSTKWNIVIIPSLLLPSKTCDFLFLFCHSGLTLINQAFSLSNIIPPFITNLNGPIDVWFITFLKYLFAFYGGYYYSISWLEMTSHILLKNLFWENSTNNAKMLCHESIERGYKPWIIGFRAGMQVSASNPSFFAVSHVLLYV